MDRETSPRAGKCNAKYFKTLKNGMVKKGKKTETW